MIRPAAVLGLALLAAISPRGRRAPKKPPGL